MGMNMMWVHFRKFWDGSCPYISWSKSGLWYMLTHYDCRQVGNTTFEVDGYRERVKRTRANNKELLRDIAKEWQYESSEMNYSYGELIGWQDFFRTYGKRFGLLREFRENGIC